MLCVFIENEEMSYLFFNFYFSIAWFVSFYNFKKPSLTIGDSAIGAAFRLSKQRIGKTIWCDF